MSEAQKEGCIPRISLQFRAPEVAPEVVSDAEEGLGVCARTPQTGPSSATTATLPPRTPAHLRSTDAGCAAGASLSLASDPWSWSRL